eukprot:CAMPEP_0116987326 /NCGR_PEP_ID=MMETSP0467-20121206/63441_1 /TAXON_ID=283647 /ORGANISM="Mesodinium pulex, Strain SPMC105" /LENGTH=60 /DNA_ID=CAMNT_0004683127 /DNA_START=341 /DNA_END=523 /DNA_ORIENTATION=+
MTIGSGNSSKFEVPIGYNLTDWIIVMVKEFFKEICLIFGILVDLCNVQVCPSMCAGSKYE